MTESGPGDKIKIASGTCGNPLAAVALGAEVGALVGAFVGARVGAFVGAGVGGLAVGLEVGALVGTWVGREVAVWTGGGVSVAGAAEGTASDVAGRVGNGIWVAGVAPGGVNVAAEGAVKLQAANAKRQRIDKSARTNFMGHLSWR